MKKEIDAQKTSDLLNSLTRHAYALQGLLDTLEIGHFGATLSGPVRRPEPMIKKAVSGGCKTTTLK